jgi:hypothetical protein
VTLGTGIFLSSILLGLILVFWITRDRVRWSRVFLWLGGGLAAIIGAFLFYDNYQPPPTRQSEYADLKLGMKQIEVSYIKGVPTHVFEDDGSKPGLQKMIAVGELNQGQKASDFLAWSYEIYNGRLDVDFDSEKRVNAIRCYAKGTYGCPSVLGLDTGSDEEEVIKRLGKPTQSALSSSATKRIVYQPLNLMFYLSKKEVYMIYVTEDLPLINASEKPPSSSSSFTVPASSAP